MYYYANIDDTGLCCDLLQSETPIDDPYYIQIDSYDRTYILRKRYIDGVWTDTTVEEVAEMAFIGEHVAMFGENEWLENVLDEKAPLDHTHEGYATSDHVHTGYVSSDDLQALEDTINAKADSTHTHYEYANVNHSHDGYATQTALDTLGEEVEGKADVGHSHTEYALSAHEHNEYAESGHNHNSDYSPISHNHTGVYDVNGAAASALSSAQTYVDSKIDALVGEGAATTLDTIGEISAAITDNQDAIDLLNSAIANKANVTDLNAHANDTEIHITDAEREIWNAKSNFSGNYNDLTNKPTIPSINGLATETYVDTQIGAIDIPDALSDLTTDSTHRVVTDAEKAAWNAKSNFSGSYNDLTNKPSIPSISGLATETYVDEAVGTKANSSHTHTIANVTGLQNALDSKSDSTHNHNASYDALGAANSALTSAQTYTDEAIDALSETVSTKANASTLTSHTGNTTIHITGAERTNWNAAKTHADSAHAPTTNATQTASGLMSKADKIKLDGIAEGANNYTLPSAGTSLGGVKSGGDVTISGGVITVNDDSHNHVISNIDGLQGILDGKAASGHTHSDVYTETEVDTLLEGKSNTSHTHTIANITNLQSTLDGKAATSHGTHVSYSTTAPVMDGSASVGTASTVARSDHKHPTDTSRAAQTSLDSHTGNKSNPHGVTLAQLGITATAAELNKMDGVTATTAELNILDGVTATTSELNYVDGVTSNIQTQLNGKASSSHTHNAATTSTAGFMSASDKAKLDGIANGANAYTLPTASSTLGGVKTTSTVTSNSGYTACPIIGGVPYYKDTNTTYNLGSFGVTATAAELNALDGITATVTELNYMDGVKSNVQTQLDGKAASSHGTHVSYGTTAPKANGTASVGTATTVSRSDHVHPLQTTVSGNAGTATKLATARTISLTGDVTGSTSFDGSGNVSITATVADDSHNHTIANVDGLQSALDGKSATSHNHNSAYISKDLQFTGDNGGAIISYNRDDGKNILTEIAALPAGFYTVYSQSGTSGNPKTTEAWRFMVHKTGVTAGWVQGYGSVGSVYTNYIDGTNGWRGWRCIWDYDPNPLWSGQYYMSSPNSTPQTVTPSKKLSECRTGWLLLWSDYDAGSGSNDSDFVTTIIPKNDPSGNKWGGKSFLCDIPRYVGSNAEDVDTERRIIKPIYVHDDCIKGSYQNDKDERNDVVLRAVYEI